MVKEYKIDEIKFSKLYRLTWGYIILVCLLAIGFIYVVNQLFNTENPSLIILIFVIISSLFYERFVIKPAINEILVKVTDEVVAINEKTIPVRNLAGIKILSSRFRHYPKVVFSIKDGREIKLNIVKYKKDYFEFIDFLSKLIV